jgi:hypothetical protein
MNAQIEEKIQAEIRRRALERADQLQKESDGRLQTESTLEAIQEITGLDREELERIAGDVRRSYTKDRKGPFSIPGQFRYAILVCGAALVLLILVLWLY